MDTIAVEPVFNLYNRQWPVSTYVASLPPAKFVFADFDISRAGYATDSMVSEGCILSGGRVNRSILSPQVRINSYSEVSDSILLENVEVGRHSIVRKAIIDKNVTIPPKTTIGVNLEEDRKRFHVTDSGIVVIAKGTHIS